MKTRMSLRNDGFSLIEILVAVALLAIAGTVIFNGFAYAARTHAKTTQLQMAEDVAQEVSEKFKAQSIDSLTTEYAAMCTDTEDTEPDAVNRTVTFTSIPWNYQARNVDGTNDNAEFTVDVKLTTKNMSVGAETGMKSLTQTGLTKPEDALTSADYTGNMTTFNQHKMDEANGYYVLDDNVGTNTFIIPEVINIYDGKRVIISEEINQYDNNVATDMQGLIMDKLTEANSEITLPENQYNVMNAGSQFEGMYWPYTRIYNKPERIKKTTTFEVITNVELGKVEYYYIVNVSYTLKFDFTLYNGKNLAAGTLSSFMDGVKDGSNLLASVTGAETSYKVEKPSSAGEYKITYSKTFNYPMGDSLSFLNGKEGTFCGKFELEGTTLNLVTDPESATSADEVPYFYILYRPFDIYTNKDYSTDEVIVKYTHNSSNKNCARVFFVVQDMNHTTDTNKIVKVNNCKLSITGGSDVLKKYFKFYTNSLEIITKNAVTGSNINADNYLTNSFNQNHENLYDMEITIYDHNGSVVARVNSVKED